MAKIKLPPIINTIRGRFGGKGRTVFRSGRTGGFQITSRSLWRSREHETFAQMLNRANWQLLDQAWRHFPKHLRILWSKCVHRSYRKPRSGLDEFRSVNLKRMHCGYPAIFAPPDYSRCTKTRYPHAPSKGKSVPPDSQVVLQGFDKLERPFGKCNGDLPGLAPAWCLSQLRECPDFVHHFYNTYIAHFECYTNPPCPGHECGYYSEIEKDSNHVEFLTPQWDGLNSIQKCTFYAHPQYYMKTSFYSLRCQERFYNPFPPGLKPGYTFKVIRSIPYSGFRGGKASYYKPAIHEGPEGQYKRYYWDRWERYCPPTVELIHAGRKPTCGPAFGDEHAWWINPGNLHFDFWCSDIEPRRTYRCAACSLWNEGSTNYQLLDKTANMEDASLTEGEGPYEGYWVLKLYLHPWSDDPDALYFRNEWGFQNGPTGGYILSYKNPSIEWIDNILMIHDGTMDYTTMAAPEVRSDLRKIVYVLALAALLGLGLVAAKELLSHETFHYYTYDFDFLWRHMDTFNAIPYQAKQNILSRVCNPYSMAAASDHDLRLRIAWLSELGILDTTGAGP